METWNLSNCDYAGYTANIQWSNNMNIVMSDIKTTTLFYQTLIYLQSLI